ncbi:MAG TPA: acyl-CoA desaturase [Acidimicrobiales bacterium]|jgi:stearoyl-CoA desaturase (delta-9 desaturase)|nr:acyl-CoA desaturase [Acidimicrobiales bacterium]
MAVAYADPDVTPRRGEPDESDEVTRVQLASAAALVVLPLMALVYAVLRFWQHGIGWFDLVLAVVLYAITGHGLTVGFHRYLTHSGFRAKRPLKVALAIAGTMGVEGSVFTWVAQHRRHHAYADRMGDPHSPWEYGSGFRAQLRGLCHAHVGWLFQSNPSEPERWIPELLADRDLAWISKTALLWSVVSLALPFALGLAVTGSFRGGLVTFLWAGLVRMLVLHHVTWSTNSITHMFGRRPFRTRDRSANVALLCILSMGESWHNAHHAAPMLARHGVDRHQLDSSARVIRIFERFGWATDVKWPTASRLAARRAEVSF